MKKYGIFSVKKNDIIFTLISHAISNDIKIINVIEGESCTLQDFKNLKK